MRSFVSIDLPEGFRPGIEELQRELKRTGADIKLVDPEQVHVTVKFLGEVKDSRVDDVAAALERAAARVEPFDAAFNSVGVFPSQSYMRVIWIGTEGDGFTQLAAAVEDEMARLGFEQEDRDFVPHATVARVKSGRKKEELGEVLDRFDDRNFGEMTIDRLILKESVLRPSGAEYSDVAVVEL